MSIINYVKTTFSKPLYQFANAIYVSISDTHNSFKAIENKRRSERALEKLDARLLEDVGLCRVENKIVSLDNKANHLTPYDVRQAANKQFISLDDIYQKQAYSQIICVE